MKSASARLGRPGLARHLLAQRVQRLDREFARLVAIDHDIVVIVGRLLAGQKPIDGAGRAAISRR